MTNEKAIEILEEVKTNNDGMSQYLEGFDEAFRLAIESLQAWQEALKELSEELEFFYTHKR